MLGFEDACQAARELGQDGKTEEQTIPLANCAGRVAADEVKAPIDSPPFDNSAMDGYALRAADLHGASPDNPVTLPLAGQVAAGDVGDMPLRPSHCIEIMTGAPLPTSADAIVPVELTQHIDGPDAPQISFTQATDQGKHIRRAGSDIAAGSILVSRGQVLHQRHILPLASLGIAALSVLSKPRIAVFATGKELVSDFDQPLTPGQIYNSNLPHAISWLTQQGCDIAMAETCGDTLEALLSAFKRAQQAGVDAIITSGGVSMGRYDLVPEAAKQAGAEILFHKIRMRPGKPQLLARLPDGPALFGLPGNPISAACGLRFLFESWRRGWLGLPAEAPTAARLRGEAQGKRGFTFMAKATHWTDETGQTHIRALPGQLSYMTAPLTEMTSWLCLPEGEAPQTGDTVPFYPVIPA